MEKSALLCKRAKKQLNWEPETSLEEGLRKTFNWFKEEKLGQRK